VRRQNLVRSQRPPPGRSSPATGTDGRPYQRPRLSPQKESARLRDLHTETSCHSDNCSPYSISDFREIDCIAIGLGMKSRLPIDYPSAWQVSGVGSAFFIPNPANYPLSIVSESAVARAGLRIAPADSSKSTRRKGRSYFPQPRISGVCMRMALQRFADCRSGCRKTSGSNRERKRRTEYGSIVRHLFLDDPRSHWIQGGFGSISSTSSR